MSPSPVFALPARLSDKASPARIAADETRFAQIRSALAAERAAAVDRRDALRRMPGTHGQEALERDLEVHRLTAQLRSLDRYGVDACLGRVTLGDGTHQYIGRFGVSDADGDVLLIDWRTPAAEPFFAATLAHPHGVRSRRRYRWQSGRIVDYWDEVLEMTGDARTDQSLGLSPDDQSAFIASLGAHRTARMRDVLGTIQADQDAIIRAGAQGALVVDGGPGTGKTVVALHRAAYLQYADPRMGPGKGGVLVIGPHRPYLSYVEDVLPSLGEEGVRVCALSDLVAEGAAAVAERDPQVAQIKASARLLDAVAAAVTGYERPPEHTLHVETPWVDVEVTPAIWAQAFTSAGTGSVHNDARDEVWDELLDLLVDLFGDADVPASALRRSLARDDDLTRAFRAAWPVLDPARVVADLYRVPAYLRRCAPWLDDAQLAALHRDDPAAWTLSDLPLLDAARRLIGDPEDVRLRRRREALRASEREVRERVVEELVSADDSELQLMSILRGQDADNSLADDDALPRLQPDVLAGPFAHVIVDEAQELTDAQWQMVLSRCPSRSITVVGDRAQARAGFAETWGERLERVGLRRIAQASLTVNYRTPSEVMDAAAPVIRAALPDANVPLSVRSSGIPVRTEPRDALDAVLERWRASSSEGTAVVIGRDLAPAPGPVDGRVRVLTPELAKGLEFDLVVLVDPERFGLGLTGAVDRYVAMTRATRELVLLEG
jgi:DNA helicase IV